MDSQKLPINRDSKKKVGCGIFIAAPLVAVAPWVLGAILSVFFCEPPSNEGNCGPASLPWLMFFTIPAAFVMLIIGSILLIAGLIRNKN